MWVEVICGLVIYRVFRRFFFCDDDDDIEAFSSSSSVLLSVAHRLEKLYGGKAYVGLRIPDADTSSRQNIDVILVTKGEAMIISVKNLSGLVSIDTDGRWVCTSGGSKHKTERHLDPKIEDDSDYLFTLESRQGLGDNRDGEVVETKQQIAILESYLKQRGVVLPEGYLSCKVVFPNPNFRTIESSYFPSEVITYEQWMKMKPESKNMFPGWIKGAFRGGKKEMQESIQQNLSFVLNTAPMWDRIELKDNKYLLGEFLEFKGKQDDIQALRNIRRSKVSRLIFQKTSMFGLARSTLQVLYSPRDYRNGGASSSEWKETSVRLSTQALFQPQSSSKVCKFKLSSIISVSLSA